MLKKMPVILIAIILAVILFGESIPLNVKEIFYATSLSIKEIIIFLLPIIIFSLLFRVVVDLSSNATWVLGIILVFVVISNFASTFLSHYVGIWIYHFNLSLIKPNNLNALVPAWTFHLPGYLPNAAALFSGIIAGFILSKWAHTLALRISKRLEWLVTHILDGFFYLIPLFVTGFLMQLQHDGKISIILHDYTSVFLMVALAQFAFIFTAFFLLNSCNIRLFLTSLRNMLPAAISAFTTMSSAATMPLTIMGAESNARNKFLARSVIPTTVNIHMIGDSIAITIFIYAIMKSYGMPEPSLMAFLGFCFYYMPAKFTVVGIPGGGVLVIYGLLKHYFGFTDEMSALMTSIYILFDPVITCANVLGNAAFSKLIDKIVKLPSSPRVVE